MHASHGLHHGTTCVMLTMSSSTHGCMSCACSSRLSPFFQEKPGGHPANKCTHMHAHLCTCTYTCTCTFTRTCTYAYLCMHVAQIMFFGPCAPAHPPSFGNRFPSPGEMVVTGPPTLRGRATGSTPQCMNTSSRAAGTSVPRGQGKAVVCLLVAMWSCGSRCRTELPRFFLACLVSSRPVSFCPISSRCILFCLWI